MYTRRTNIAGWCEEDTFHYRSPVCSLMWYSTLCISRLWQIKGKAYSIPTHTLSSLPFCFCHWVYQCRFLSRTINSNRYWNCLAAQTLQPPWKDLVTVMWQPNEMNHRFIQSSTFKYNFPPVSPLIYSQIKAMVIKFMLLQNSGTFKSTLWPFFIFVYWMLFFQNGSCYWGFAGIFILMSIWF